jgi:hypothetical protein
MSIQKKCLALEKFGALQSRVPPRFTADIQRLGLMIDTIFDPSVPSRLKGMEDLSRLAINIRNPLHNTPAYGDASFLFDLLRDHLTSLGHLAFGDILTPREQKIRGSSPHYPEWDVPEGLQSGSFSQDKIETARGLTACFPAMLAYFDISASHPDELAPFIHERGLQLSFSTVNVSLEPLDSDGKVVGLPRLVRFDGSMEYLSVPLKGNFSPSSSSSLQ